MPLVFAFLSKLCCGRDHMSAVCRTHLPFRLRERSKVMTGNSLTKVLTFRTALDHEQPTACQKICYFIRWVLHPRHVPESRPFSVSYGMSS